MVCDLLPLPECILKGVVLIEELTNRSEKGIPLGSGAKRRLDVVGESIDPLIKF